MDGYGLKLHTRVLVVQKAETEIEQAVTKVLEERELTPPELISILSRMILITCKGLIQVERHPNDPSKRGGEA